MGLGSTLGLGTRSSSNHPSKTLTDQVNHLAFPDLALAFVALANVDLANSALTRSASASPALADLYSTRSRATASRSAIA